MSVAHLAFFTRDRPDSCGDAVARFAAASMLWREQPAITVFDGTTDAGTRDRLRARLREAAAESKAAISYAGEDEKNEFLFRIGQSLGPQSAEASFGLYPDIAGVTTGANCNALFLHHTGNRVLLLADDQRPGACRLGEVGEAITTDEFDPMTAWRFRTRDDALSARDVEAIDLASEHDAVHERTGATLVMSGVWGDCAMSSADELSLCKAGNRGHVTAHYGDIANSRQVVRGVESLVVSTMSSPAWKSSGSSIDLSDLVPLMLPIGRDQDALFATTLRACSPESSVAYAPIAIRHEPEERMFSKAERELFAGPPRIVELLSAATIASAPAAQRRGGTTATRIEALGRELEALAQEGDTAEQRLRDAVRRVRLGIADRLTAASERSSMPVAYRDDVSRAADAIRSGVERNWNMTADLAGRGVLHLILRYGELLAVWPTLWRAATDIPIAKPV